MVPPATARIVTGGCLSVKHNGRPSSMRSTSPTTSNRTVKLSRGWDDMRVPEEVRKYLSRLGKKGGPARSNKLTPEQRARQPRTSPSSRPSAAVGAMQ